MENGDSQLGYVNRFKKRLKDLLRPWLRPIWRTIVPEPVPNCDAETIAVLSKVLPSNATTVDVGCNRGAILNEIIRFAPHGKHYAFEPIPALCRSLRRHFSAKAVIHQMALSDRDGESEFHRFERYDPLSGFINRPVGTNGVLPDRIKIISVRTTRLDSILPDRMRVDFIKIDVEGAEYLVFRGAERVIKQSRPVIVFECGKGGLDLYGFSPEKVHGFLTECGLLIRRLRGWSSDLPSLTQEQFISIFNTNSDFMFVASPY